LYKIEERVSVQYKKHASMSKKPEWPVVIAEILVDNLTILLTIGFAGYILFRDQKTIW